MIKPAKIIKPLPGVNLVPINKWLDGQEPKDENDENDDDDDENDDALNIKPKPR